MFVKGNEKPWPSLPVTRVGGEAQRDTHNNRLVLMATDLQYERGFPKWTSFFSFPWSLYFVKCESKENARAQDIRAADLRVELDGFLRVIHG